LSKLSEMKLSWESSNYHKTQTQKIGTMKTIKEMKRLMILMVALLPFSLLAQDYKIAAGNSRLMLEEVNEVNIEGYDGSEVVFSVVGSKVKPDRAEGLKAISGLGLEDNTGMGLSVVKEGTDILVRPLSPRSDTRYTIKVPKNMSLYYKHSTHWGEDFVLNNHSGELEISTNHNDITLTEVTGPMTVKTVHGEIEAKLSTIKSPLSMVSMHGYIDLSLPASVKANVELQNNWGEMFTDFDIKMDQSADMKKLSSSEVRGTINGGGSDIQLSSSHGDIYLRKQ